MKFRNQDDNTEFGYKKNHTCKCEECGYIWVENLGGEEDGIFFEEEEREYCCPMCGGSYLNQM